MKNLFKILLIALSLMIIMPSCTVNKPTNNKPPRLKKKVKKRKGKKACPTYISMAYGL